VEPGWLPASSIIDWTLKGHRIGDRAKPLADKTRRRIAAGIARYWAPIHLEAAGNTYDAADSKHPQYRNPNSYYRAWPTDEVLRTLHTIESKALAIPPLFTPVGGKWDDTARSSNDVMRTQTTNDGIGVVFPPPLITSYYGNSSGAQSVAEALPTVTTADRHALLMRNNSGGAEMTTPAWQVARTITTAGHQSLLTSGDIEAASAQVDDVFFRMLEPSEVKRAMAFPSEYQILGNRREQVRMCGNAVTPPAARDLIGAVVDSLSVAS
jgi:DNA (cytosine-5)-methyltransferase 1